MNPSVRIVASQSFTVPAERVFDTWLDPEQIGRWMTGLCSDDRLVPLEIEPRAGGIFSFTAARQGKKICHVGKFLEFDRPGLVVFTWTNRDSLSETSRVVVEILPRGGGCDLTLTHVTKAGRTTAGQAADSWGRMLRALAGELAERNNLTLNVS